MLSTRFTFITLARLGLADVRMQSVCAYVLKGQALPHASHSGDIALSGSRRLRPTLAAAPVLFAHAVVAVARNSTSATSRLTPS